MKCFSGPKNMKTTTSLENLEKTDRIKEIPNFHQFYNQQHLSVHFSERNLSNPLRIKVYLIFI